MNKVDINIIENYFIESGISYVKDLEGCLLCMDIDGKAKVGIIVRKDEYLLNINPYYFDDFAPFHFYHTTDAVEAYKMIARYYFEDIIDTKFKEA